MSRVILRGLVGLFVYMGLIKYILQFFHFFKFDLYEVKLLKFLERNGQVGTIPNIGFGKVINYAQKNSKAKKEDLHLLMRALKFEIIDSESSRHIIAALLNDFPDCIELINNHESFQLVKYLCEPRTVEFACRIIDKFDFNSDENIIAAKAYYYHYTHQYDDSINSYLKIPHSKHFNVSHMVYMVSILGKYQEADEILLRTSSRRKSRYIMNVANRCCILLRRGELEITDSIKILNVLKSHNYSSCKNLISSICFSSGNYSSVVHLKNSIFNQNKIAHVSGIEYVYSVLELEGIDKAYVAAEKTIALLENSNSYRILWRYSLLLSNIFDKAKLSSLFSETLKARFRLFSVRSGNDYVYDLLFGNVACLINNIHTRFDQGKKFLGSPSGKDKKFRFVSIKNINYAYIMSSCFDLYDDDDIVLCEERFLDIFQNSFCNTKFVSVSRPKTDSVLTTPEWYGSAVKKLAMSTSDIVPQQLCFEHLESVRLKGWLKGNECILQPIDETRKNIGISFGSGLTTGFRSAYNIPYSILSLFDRTRYNLINLDYHLDSEIVSELGLEQPDFDLKNDMAALGNLMSSLDAIVCIPNNIMDAGAAYGKLTIVYDPFGRTSYWQYKDTDEYVFGSRVFLYQRRFDNPEERDESFFREVCGRLNDEL
nr:hypothetical protein [Vibrio lentus]PMH99348.1 hypothetical protein BCU54_20575 [Vibrio lentus]